MPDLHVRNLDEATLDQLRAQAEETLLNHSH
jgi:plasmid stability protein